MELLTRFDIYSRATFTKQDDIPAVVKQNTAPALIEKLSSLSDKYRFFEERLLKGKQSLEEKILEVKRAITAVSALAERAKREGDNARPIETHFELSDGIYARASIPPSTSVCLWLGANVMVEYSHDEALQLLNSNLKSAQENYSQTCKDIVYLRDQLNTTDVNLSRVYNHHVQAVRASGGSSSSVPGAAARVVTAK